MQQPGVDETVANLNRLAQRPGVQATIVLSRPTGAIVQSSGLDSKADINDADVAIPSRENGADERADVRSTRLRSLEEVASLVFDYVKASAAIAQGMNGTKDDELKLLRMRTKRNELVIVPDAHYIAVVIHDTPPA